MLLRFCRLNHFTPVFLLLAPSVWCMITLGFFVLIVKHMFILMLMIMLMIGGGCIYNDFIDLDYDRLCARTKDRPMASCQVSKYYAIFSVPFFIMFFYLGTYLSEHSFSYISISFLFTLLYPWMKRVSKYPQIFLGLSSTAPIVAYIETSLNQNILPSLGFYLISVLWIVLYDTLYAWGDRDDDKRLSLGNIGLVIGEKYMPMFMDLIWLSIASILGFYYFYVKSVFNVYSISAVVFLILVGIVQRSRFVKGYVKGTNKDICNPGVIGLIVSLLLLWSQNIFKII